MDDMKKIGLQFIILVCVVILAAPGSAFALELVISGNGDGSSNEVQTSVEQNTTVEQTNEGSVENNVSEEANTGGNTADGNVGGEVSIETGDIQAITQVTNDFNTTVVDVGECCQEETTVLIEGNGTDSQNTVELALSNQTLVSVNQEANVTNFINGWANTGRNDANDNGGNVRIDTGNISAGVKVTNSANHADIKVEEAGSGSVSLAVKGNGDDSRNTIRLSLENQTIVDKHDVADIDNFIVWEANTGENTANGNLGDVAIVTGDINLVIDIVNGPINDEVVIIGGCCSDPDDPYDPGDPPTEPSTPPTGGPSSGGNNSSSGNSSSGNGSSGGEVLAAAVGTILPATGGFDFLLAMMANIATFLMGVYLRLKSGRAPARTVRR
ncbi:MAG: hypothetical protein A2785_00985 [Candidatus Chisholmbacteria bacterium RIFCSPHIGHO2_01_FULL_49_18]|uniref:Uncharacterized protein n=1 Tax=Candidatus Chisholmbacteria bacterium RIFCSPHIGHO2_01_FULL_49_18 TaxID=1797590 RepID=A0A1G1VL76_9BACT|nr:MAG: hypothetical protein A2785_00985 [Candidatus Chisholmbacteria bacterium RIFCSPHIGHO2_01_FULL_49_18]